MKIAVYIVRNVLLYSAIFFGALFIALFANYISGYLNKAANGYIGFATVVQLLLYIAPNLILLILPMSVFGGVFTTFRQLAVHNELVALLSCGVTWKKLFLYASIPVLVITTITLLLSFFIVPKSLADFQMLIANTSVKSLKYIKSGKFYQLSENKEVFFDHKKEILLIALGKDHDSLTYSPRYFIKKLKDTHFLLLHHGWNAVLNTDNKSMKQLHFNSDLLALDAKAMMPHLTIAAMTTKALLSASGFKADVELRWRLYTGLLPIITLFLVFPFCGGVANKKSYVNTIVAIACFVGFSMLSSTLKNRGFGFEGLGVIVFVNGLIWLMLKDKGVRIIG